MGWIPNLWTRSETRIRKLKSSLITRVLKGHGSIRTATDRRNGGFYSETRVDVSGSLNAQVDATTRERRPATKIKEPQFLWFRSKALLSSLKSEDIVASQPLPRRRGKRIQATADWRDSVPAAVTGAFDE
jgi:hypothetical protein